MAPKIGDLWHRFEARVSYPDSYEVVYPWSRRAVAWVHRTAEVIAVTPKTVLLRLPSRRGNKRQRIGSARGAWKPTKAEAQASCLARAERRCVLLESELDDARAILASARSRAAAAEAAETAQVPA